MTYQPQSLLAAFYLPTILVLLEKVQSPSDCASKLNHDLTLISDWAKRWLVTMKETKTKSNVFSTKRDKPLHPPPPPLILNNSITPFAVHYEKKRNHLRETATNSAKIHSSARKYEHLRINFIQLRFLHFNQHTITLLGIHMGHRAYKREKHTFINANIKVINTILKVNMDN